jgi:hypothetical protein
MPDTDFFQGIHQHEFEDGGHRFRMPTFFTDITTINATFVAPLERVKARLPSPQLKPLRVTPWHALAVISAVEYRASDVGPYNEVSISLPVTVGRSALPGLGPLRAMQEVDTYVLHLPVTTEIGRYLGAEFYGLPKFIAQIEFSQAEGWRHCRLSEKGQHILTLSGRELATKPGSRMNIGGISRRAGGLLRTSFVHHLQQVGRSYRPSEVRLELGQHPIADELRDLKLGRMLELRYVARHQAILSTALESFAI